MKRIAILAALILSIAGVAQAEGLDSYIEALRQDIKAEKVSLITDVMQFTDAESAVFWPIYRQYQVELDAINDQRLALIKDFAGRYETMTDTKALELMDTAVKLDAERTKLRDKYMKRFRKELPGKTVARYFQLERQINLLMDLQIAVNLPLLQ